MGTHQKVQMKETGHKISFDLEQADKVEIVVNGETVFAFVVVDKYGSYDLYLKGLIDVVN